MPSEELDLPKDVHGLKQSEIEDKLKSFGRNILPEIPPPSSLSTLISQLKNPLVYILLASGLITLFLKEIADSLIIFLAVAVNTFLGFIQERRASKALWALKKLIHPTAEVIRDGKRVSIEVENIVPGDVAVLNTGTKVPADGKVVFANRMFIDESVLTGESVSVGKREKQEIFMGTSVASGRGYMLVESTGAKTKIGEIAKRVQEPEEDTPLKAKLKILSKQLSILVFSLTVFVFITGILLGRDVSEIFTTSVALAVSSIPEGLLVGLTVVLAIGMQKILRRKGLVRHLVSAETLGGVTTICSDKTGTLTEGKMQVVEVFGNVKNLSIQSILANDLDDPIVIAAFDWAKKNMDDESLLKKHKKFDSIPFSSKSRFFASLNKWDGKNNMVFVNGAPDYLLKWSIISSSQEKKIKEKIDSLTKEGKRVVGMARKKVSLTKDKVSEKDVHSSLSWVGLLAFSDPVRTDVKKALEKTRAAGIKTLVITGDYSQTAMAVMSELGMGVDKSEVMEGSQLERLSSKQLQKVLSGEKTIKLFARTTPEQKLKIVKALKSNNEVVAMMGDGVNDAPALKLSDIGIVVGEATDVAKETADLVLLDSSFETVVSAVEEGRGIFDNIRKIMLYLLSDAFEEIIAVLGTLILGLPLPVSAAQILWINLISDGFPDLALAVDPRIKGIMKLPPRNTKEPLLAGWMRLLIGIISFVGGFSALLIFIFYFKKTGDLSLARTITFLSLGLNSLVFVFSVRTLTKSFWDESILNNKWLNLAVATGFFFQFLPLFDKRLTAFFGLKVPSFSQVGMVFVVSIFTFIMIEVIKSVIRKHIEWFQH